MTVHRHLEIPPDTPLEALPSAAIVDLLERGDLTDWRPLLRAIQSDPFGPLATRVMHLVDAYSTYGTGPLWRAWIERQRARATGPAVPPDAVRLPDLRKEHGLTQVELASRLGMTQSDLSKLERRNDVRLSTLRAYVEALGGSLHVRFVRREHRRRIRLAPRPPA